MRQSPLRNEYELVGDDDGAATAEDDELEEQESRSIEKASSDLESTEYLNGLRGLAAFMVFQQHTFGLMHGLSVDHFHGFGEAGHYDFISLPGIRLFYSGGAAAVCTFFVLSGFVIVQNLLRLHQAGEQRQFYRALVSAIIRRPFRLYLPCWIIGFARAFLKHIPLFRDALNQWGSVTEPSLGKELRRYVPDTLTYFQPFRNHDFYSGIYAYGPVMWTIPIELKGSLMVYAIVGVTCWARFRPILTAAILGTLGIVLFVAGWWAMGCFVAGLLMAVLQCNGMDCATLPRNTSTRTASALKMLIFIVALYLLSQPNLDHHPESSTNTFGWHYMSLLVPGAYTETSFYRFWVSIGAILLVALNFYLPWLQRFFTTRPLQYLGKVSFMLYLTHLPLAYMIANSYLARTFGSGAVDKPSWWDNRLYIPDIGPKGLSTRWAVQWTILFSLALGVAHLATRFIDEPCLRFSRWVGDRTARPLQPSKDVDADIALEGQQSLRLSHLTHDATLRPVNTVTG